MMQFLVETLPRPLGGEDVRWMLYRPCLPLNCLARCRYGNLPRSLRTAPIGSSLTTYDLSLRSGSMPMPPTTCPTPLADLFG